MSGFEYMHVCIYVRLGVCLCVRVWLRVDPTYVFRQVNICVFPFRIQEIITWVCWVWVWVWPYVFFAGNTTSTLRVLIEMDILSGIATKKRFSCLTLNIIRYGSRVKWSNPGNGVAPSPTPWCSSYRKGSLRVTLDYGR